MLRLLLVSEFLLVFGIRKIIFYLFGLHFLFLAHVLIVEFVFNAVAILITPIMKIVDSHEYFTQVQVLLAKLLIALLNFRLHLILLMYFVLYLTR
jgi:hypothetical protein